MHVVIVIPTYNERKNITRLIPQIFSVSMPAVDQLDILVVDDMSPDGTGEAVQELTSTYPNVHLITGPKMGLGKAYIRGMTHVLNTFDADVIMEMDADFSHDPQDIPRLLSEIDGGAEFVIGSRYVKGGSIPSNWGFHRRLNSLLGNLVARYVTDMRKVQDTTAGFRAIKTSLLKQIDLINLRVQGYAFQIALLRQAVIRGATITEVPVDFVDRTEGESKLGPRDIIEFFINVWWIRLEYHSTAIKFGLVGASGALVNLSLFSILIELGLNKFIASPIAIEASIVNNFLLNNYWTFGHRKTRDRTRVKGIKFNIVSFGSLLISFSTFTALSFLFPEVPPQVHQVIAIGPAMFVNYFANTYWTFRSHE